MERETTLFEYVYGDLVREITGGALRPGDTLPSMGELGKRYRVGARTVRDVLKALKDDGYIATEERRRATVAFRSSDDDVERAARSLLARRDELLTCYRTLELVMPPLYAFAARHCRADELAALGRALERADVENRSGDWRLSRSSLVLHELLDKAGNPLFSECYDGLERASAVPALPGFADPYVRATEESDNLLGWMFASLSGDDPAEVQRRFGLLYRGTAEYVERYLDELDAAYPGTEGGGRGFSWNARTGRSYVHAQMARDLVERIAVGEFPDGSLLPSIASLAQSYGASASTVQKALGVLNAMGVASTSNGRGTQVRTSDARFDPRALADGSFRRDLQVFADALQMLCIVLPAALGTVADRIDGVAGDAERALGREAGPWAVPKALMEGFLGNVPLDPLRDVLGELNSLLLWGYFLVFFGPSGASAPVLEALGEQGLEALRSRDAVGFARAMDGYYRLMLAAVRTFLEAAGMPGTERLAEPAPDATALARVSAQRSNSSNGKGSAKT